MFNKKLVQTVSVALAFVLTMSFCGCSTTKSVARDTVRITQFTNEAIAISKLEDHDEMMARAEALIHPASGLTIELLMEAFKEDEAFEGMDVEKALSRGYTIGKMSDPKLHLNYTDVGGNVYEITVDLTLDGQVFLLTIYILSDETTIGLFNFDVTK